MRTRWWILLLLGFGLIIGPVIKKIPGFVIIAFNQTTVQIPLWLAITSALLLILITATLLVMFGQIVSTASKAKKWRASRKWKRARKETISAMLFFAEGDWQRAENMMINASKYGDTKLINYLIAAQSAQKQLAVDRRDKYLKKAKEISPQADIAIGLTQARLQIECEQHKEALASLILLSEIAPNNKYINQLFVEVNLKLEKWQVVLSKIPLLEKQHLFSEKKIKEFHKRAVCGVMKTAFKESTWEELQQFWKKQARKIKKDPGMILEYVGVMMEFGKDREAEPILMRLLKHQASPEALKIFARLRTGKPGKQLDFLESLPRETEFENDYYEALAELSREAELWGKTKDYLEKSLALGDSVSTRAILANTLEKLGEVDQAQKQREKAVKLLEYEKLS